MIIDNCEQGTEEWFAARLAIPTASCFDKIITSTGKPSTQAKTYMNKLLAEHVTGKPANNIESNEWMERGKELEAEARDYYKFQKDCEVEQVGLIYKDEAKLVACSPDGLMTNKGIEIKCPAPGTHVEYLLGKKLPTKYFCQVQGSMWVTGLDAWDFLSYHPDMKPLLITVERDEKFMKSMDEVMGKFIDEMLTKRELLQEAA